VDTPAVEEESKESVGPKQDDKPDMLQREDFLVLLRNPER
jgi:hypothetical protein